MKKSLKIGFLFIICAVLLSGCSENTYLIKKNTYTTNNGSIVTHNYTVVYNNSYGGGWTNTTTNTTTFLNVGIKRTNPSYPLDVNLTNTIARFTDGATASGIWTVLGGFVSISGKQVIGMTGGTDFEIRNGSTQYGSSALGGTTRFSVLDTGLIGIGTASPTELLTLSVTPDGASTNRKTIQLNNGGWAPPGNGTINSDGDKLIFYEAAGEAYKIGLEGSYIWIQTESGAKFFNTEGLLRAKIATDNSQNTFFDYGNVGIGTTNPTMPLYVNTSTGVVIDRYGSAFGPSLNLYEAGKSVWIIHGDVSGNANNTFSIRDNSSNDRLSINYITGNVGIGTITPNQKLNVVGNANISGTVYYGALVASSPHAFMDDESGHTEICMIAEDGTVVLHTVINDRGIYKDNYIPNSPVCLNKKVLTQAYDVDMGDTIKTVSEYAYLFGTKETFITEKTTTKNYDVIDIHPSSSVGDPE